MTDQHLRVCDGPMLSLQIRDLVRYRVADPEVGTLVKLPREW